MPLERTVEFLRNKGRIESSVRPAEDWRYDLTVASGLMYHVAAPMPLMGYLRSITRAGGLVLLETAVLNRPEYDMRYCFDGDRYIYGWSDTWFPSVPLLDHLLRTCRLRPLDLLYLDHGSMYPGLIRIAVVCRATEDVIEADGETSMPQTATNVDFALSMELEGDHDRQSLPFRAEPEGLIMRAGIHSCDLYATVNARAAYKPTDDEIRLRLDAVD
jgi:hypothetical protein